MGGGSGFDDAGDGGDSDVGGGPGGGVCDEDCDDGIGCTVDRCVFDECAATPDHDRCNAGQVCLPADGGCVPAAECETHANCAVDDPCQVGVCRASTGHCTTTPIDLDGDGEAPRACGGLDCDDEDPELVADCGDEEGGDDEGGDDEGGDDEVIEEPPFDGPRLTIVPGGEVVFDGVLQGERETRTIHLRNTGGADLEIDQIDLVNNANGDFSVAFSEDSPIRALPATLHPGDEDGFVEIDIGYQPQRAGNDTGQIRVRSNDPVVGEAVVNVVGRSIFPCVQVLPVDVDFGAVLIDTVSDRDITVTNCGNAELELRNIDMVDGSSEDFELIERPRLPIVLQGNVSATLTVRYAPADVGADGGRVALATNIPDNEVVEINLFGRGTEVEAPRCRAQARIAGAPDWAEFPDEDAPLGTIPLRVLELRGSAVDGQAAAYRWTVTRRPEDSTSRIRPHEGAPEVTFFLDLAGLYELQLEITDNLGVACPAASVFVRAVPDEDIHVQMVWDTPADPDQTDTGFGAGADVDLHFKHPLGDWFCSPRDTYYANPNPDWGVPFDPADDPSMDIDDTDGAGPENINLNNPENNRVYRVGVHYFNDHGYGPSFTTIRVFIQGAMAFELANKRLRGTDVFWDVATVAWPSGAITPIDQVFDAPPLEDCQ